MTGYNQKNPTKAKALLAEAGYKGEPVRWITTKEYDWMYNTSLVAKQQMEAAGFTVDLQVLDWATLVQRRNKPELYDIFSTGFTLGADPALATSVQCNWPGWWCQEEKERVLAEMLRETDPKKRGPRSSGSRPSSTRTSGGSSSATTSPSRSRARSCAGSAPPRTSTSGTRGS